MIDRLRNLDPLGPALAVIAGAVFMLHGFEGRLGRDLAIYAYAGQRVADGIAPYVGVMNRAGPLAHLIPGAGAWAARLVGTDDVLTIRAEMAVISVAAVWMLYVLGRDLFSSRSAGMVSAVTLLTFRGFVDIASGGPREKTPMLLFVEIGIWSVLHRRWGLAGVMIALATLTWQPAFFLSGAVAAGALVVLPRRELARGSARVAAGGVATTAVFVLGFWLWGALDDFVEGFLLINARYTHQSTLVDYLQGKPDSMVDGYGPALWLLLLGLLATLALAAVRLRSARADPAHATLLGLGLGTLASIGWAALFAFNGWPDAVVTLPSAALGVAGVLLAVGRPLRARPAGPTAVLVSFSMLALAFASYDAARTRSDVLPDQRREINAVLHAAPEGSTLVSLAAPEALVLSGRVNPNPYQMYIAGFRDYLEATYPGGLQGFARLVASEHPTLIAVDHLEWYDFMQPLITADYTKVGDAGRFTWYARTDLGEAALTRIHRAAGTAS